MARIVGRLAARSAALAALSVLLAGCASKDSPTFDERDPIEPVNRVVFKFNDVVDRILFRPAAHTYEFVVPDVARQGVNNFFSNVGTVGDMVNNFLQGKPREGFSDAARIALNTTVGWFGLFDPATDAGLAKHNEDFGQTLGVWGFSPGPYLMLPILGPQTVRSTVGFWTVDRQLRILRYDKNTRRRQALLALNIIRIRANLLFLNKQLDRAYDPYVFVRDAILQRQRFLRYDGRPPQLDDGLQDEDFDEAGFDEDEEL
ncbi:MAG: VacJ family lipoprotein [Chromatiales bacterium]|nr:MAG: VacJ family lipoprotein [Chromatiales bacterium]